MSEIRYYAGVKLHKQTDWQFMSQLENISLDNKTDILVASYPRSGERRTISPTIARTQAYTHKKSLRTCQT